MYRYHDSRKGATIQAHGNAERHNGQGPVATDKAEENEADTSPQMADTIEDLPDHSLGDPARVDETVRDISGSQGHGSHQDVGKSRQSPVLKDDLTCVWI